MTMTKDILKMLNSGKSPEEIATELSSALTEAKDLHKKQNIVNPGEKELKNLFSAISDLYTAILGEPESFAFATKKFLNPDTKLIHEIAGAFSGLSEKEKIQVKAAIDSLLLELLLGAVLPSVSLKAASKRPASASSAEKEHRIKDLDSTLDALLRKNGI